MGSFAVRTFYRTAPIGRPRQRDQFYLAAVVAVEERIVLFRAKSGKGALKQATAEGRKYATAVLRNRYGQRVVTKLLKRAEAYELNERPGQGVEIFSAVELTAPAEQAGSILARKVGRPADGATAHMFIDGGIAAELERRSANWPMKPANHTLQRTAHARRR